MMMPHWVHIQTLNLALTFANCGSALFLLLLFLDRRRFPGAEFWIFGQTLLATGSMSLVIQSTGLPYNVLAIPHVAMLASVVVMGHAVWKFRCGPGFPVSSYGVIPLGLFTWFAMSGARMAIRIVVFSGALGILASLVTAILLARSNKARDHVYSITAVYFISIAAAGFARALAAVTGHPPRTIAESGTLGGFEYALAMIVIFSNIYAYFLMSAAQVERDLHSQELEIRKRNEELVETIDTKDALIAVLGHDLRAPVWSATRYVRGHLVDFKGDLNTKRENIETLAEGLERISGLLDSLLEWALCASGRLKLESVPINMASVIGDAISDIRSTAAGKTVTIESSIDDSLVSGDRRALATVFRNLLSNAVKYSRSGSTVRVSGARTVSVIPLMRIEVADHGTGMKSEQLSKLFVPGRTMLTLGTDGEQGKGFGLAISKLFVDAMGGTMTVESELDVGTRFVLDFPISPSN
jgi:signal transduction histidine kinase